MEEESQQGQRGSDQEAQRSHQQTTLEEATLGAIGQQAPKHCTDQTAPNQERARQQARLAQGEVEI